MNKMDTNEGSKRRRANHNDKSDAFMKLKKLKTAGIKNKYELEPLEPVYDEITENEYTNRVLKRQNDDWIVDDGDGDGYIEDGREIFDDDIADNYRAETKSKKSKHLISNKNRVDNGIKKMFSNISARKKTEATVKDDDILGNLMNELDSTTNTKNSCNNITSSSKSCIITQKTDISVAKPKLQVKNSFSSPTCDPHLLGDSSNNDIGTGKNDALSIDVKDNDNDSSKPSSINSNSNPSLELNKSEKDVEKSDVDNINWDDEFFEPGMGDVFSDLNDIQSIAENEDVINEEEKHSVLNEDCDAKSFRFFYWDAYEDNSRPGIVFLFGKTWDATAKSYVSCCILVKNIEHRIFLLPREEVNGTKVTLLDVYNEFNEKVAVKYKIMEFKTKKVKKQYAFNLPSVPDESEYLEIRYSASYPSLPTELEGNTFSHVFGIRTSFLETLLLGKAIKGPCWLEIPAPEYATNNLSWCKVEVICSNYDQINVVHNGKSTPPLVIAVLNISTAVLPKSNDNCILMISCLVNNNYHIDKDNPPSFSSRFCAFTRPVDVPWPLSLKEIISKQTGPIKFERMDTERALLSYFLAKMCQIDPDVIVGHDIHGFDIGVLIHRLITNKISQWSRIGRLRRNQAPTFGKNSNALERNILCGRLLCDTRIMAKELISCRSYDLKNLYRKITHPDIDDGAETNDNDDTAADEIRSAFGNVQSLINFIKMKNLELIHIVKIMNNLNMLPLAIQITNIAGNVLSRTLLGGRSERNEFLLLHAFHSKNYIVPDKMYSKFVKKDSENAEGSNVEATKRNQKSQYEGGLVLEPKRGFYDKMILLLDFNSLYPSIIQEYNICFTTIPLRSLSSVEGKEYTLLSKSSSLPLGILPTEIRKLVESRYEVKKLLQKSDLTAESRHKYNIRQLALKLTANSMYGCLGFSQSRFYAKPLAALVTAKGREILMNSRDLVQKLNYDVIYGDTDSIMINTNSLDYDEVYKIGYKIKGEVNKLYKKIELDIDAVFKYMLLLKKKKYAAISIKKMPDGVIQSKNEIKGLDIVRRDWSVIASEVGRYVVLQILSESGIDEKVENIYSKMKEVKTALEENKIPLKKLTITKQLTKNPNEYPDGKNLPHVQVALRVNATVSKQFKRGDTIPYVICKDGSDVSAVKRAYHIDEINTKNNDLKIDVDYYLSQQIFPVVSRLCEPVSAIDTTEIAKCLGLSLALSNRNQFNETDNNDCNDAKPDFGIDEFQNCERFSFKCINTTCIDLINIDIPMEKEDKISLAFDHYTMNQCATSLPANLPHIQNILCLSVRRCIQKYYRSRDKCTACDKTTRRISCISKSGMPICKHCSKGALTRTYTESDLYQQLCYFQTIFDLPRAMQKIKDLKIHHESDCFLAYVKLKIQMDIYLQYSAFNKVNFENFSTNLLRKKHTKL